MADLFEELLHAARGPLVMEVPPLGGVGHVTGVQQQAQHFRLVQASVNIKILRKIRNRNGLAKQQKKRV
jgi:hypothetical protein